MLYLLGGGDFLNPTDNIYYSILISYCCSKCYCFLNYLLNVFLFYFFPIVSKS